MTTPLRLRALDYWEKIINQNLWAYPIHWCPGKKEFYSGLSTKYEIAVFLTVEFLLILIGVCCSGFLLLKQIVKPSPDVSILHLVLWGVAFCGISLSSSGAFLFYFNKEYIVLIFKEIFEMETYFKNKNKTQKSKTRIKLDYLGIFLNWFVGFGLVIPLMMPFVSYLEFDFWFGMCKLIFSEEFNRKFSLPLLLGRIFVGTYFMLGGIRLAWLLLIYSIICLKIILFCCEQIKGNTNLVLNLVTKRNAGSFYQRVSEYRRFNTLIEMLNNLLMNTEILVALSGGLIISVVCFFVIIRMPIVLKIFPLVYICAIGGVVILLVLLHYELPDVVSLHEMTSDNIRLWKLQSCLLENRKHVQKVLRSLRPCSFGAGFGENKLFILKQSTSTTYFSMLIDYIVTSLIAQVEVKF